MVPVEPLTERLIKLEERQEHLIEVQRDCQDRTRRVESAVAALREVVHNGLLDRVRRIDARVWWIIASIVAANGAAALVLRFT